MMKRQRHLDALWSHSAIDAVGIDAYFPLTDWRDGDDHLDAQLSDNIYQPDYLKRGMEGGEGFDYYYASDDDRAAQIRTDIYDGAYGKSWVFRFKDIRRWWGEPHINRLDGVETDSSDWTPRSKPFWFTEIGCPAIDKGSNQPNVFYDPKSAEGAAPHFSSNGRDDLIQRRYIETFVDHYSGVNNPQSDIYDGRMVDTDASHIWCWDARPFPDFPARDSVWADGGNWERGHWITGRAGLVSVADVVEDLAAQSGLLNIDCSKISGLLEGYLIDRPMSARAAIGPLSLVYGFDAVETAQGLAFVSQSGAAVTALSVSDIAAGASDDVHHIKNDPETHLRDVRVHFIDGARDYQGRAISARKRFAETVRILDIDAPLVMDEGLAQITAERLLTASETLDAKVQFTLSPVRYDCMVGDVVQLPSHAGLWQITDMDGPGAAQISARAYRSDFHQPVFNGVSPAAVADPIWLPKPHLVVLDIPNFNGSSRLGPLVGAFAAPFNTAVISSAHTSATVTDPVKVGALLTDMPAGPIGRWDHAAALDIYMPGLQISSATDQAVLSGSNSFAVETSIGELGQGWEVFQAANVILTRTGQYRLSRLLRGLSGTDANMEAITHAGARVVWLGQGLADLPVDDAFIGTDVTAEAVMAGRVSAPVTASYSADHLRPLAPVHGRVSEHETSLELTWIRRTRIGGDRWSGLDVPIGEESEFYQVSVIFTDGNNADFNTLEPRLSLPNTPRADITSISIAQGSRAYGFGPPLRLVP